MEKIKLFIDDQKKPAEFYVLEQTRISGFSYILVTDQEDGDGEAWILKDLSKDGETEAVYEFVEDDNELQAVGAVFANMLDDMDLV